MFSFSFSVLEPAETFFLPSEGEEKQVKMLYEMSRAWNGPCRLFFPEKGDMNKVLKADLVLKDSIAASTDCAEKRHAEQKRIELPFVSQGCVFPGFNGVHEGAILITFAGKPIRPPILEISLYKTKETRIISFC